MSLVLISGATGGIGKAFTKELASRGENLFLTGRSQEKLAELKSEIEKEYSNIGVKMFSVSSKNGDGIDELKKYLTGKLSVFAGQSAVGKTSITNAMFSLQLKTGDLSQRMAPLP